MSKLKEKTLVTLKEEAAVDYPFSDDLPLVYLGNWPTCRNMEFL